MKDIYIADLKTGQDFMSYFIVKTVAVKVGSNKKAYLDLLLADKTGEISAKKWDIADEEMPGLQRIKEGSVIKVKALVTEWNGMKQLRVSRIRQTSAEDGIRGDYDQLMEKDMEKLLARPALPGAGYGSGAPVCSLWRQY